MWSRDLEGLGAGDLLALHPHSVGIRASYINPYALLHCALLKVMDQWADAIITIGETIRHHPELGFKEFKTAALVAKTLRDLSVLHKIGLAIPGVKGELQGHKTVRQGH